MSKLKTIFFGTSSFGLPTLDWLLANTDLKAVVTTPDKPAGRRLEFVPSPVRHWSSEHDYTALQPELLHDPAFSEILEDLDADVAIVASYGKIVPSEILNLARYHTLNLHPSLLPKYRGAAPIQSALLAGDTVTGTTLMLMDEKLDHGPIVAQQEVIIEPGTDFDSLHDTLAQASVLLLASSLDNYINGSLTPVPQNDLQATFTKKFTKEDGRIIWTYSAEEIDRRIRALNPWPGTYTELTDGRILKLFKTVISDKHGLSPAHVLIEGKRMFIGTNTTALEVLELQVAGGKRLTAEQFIAGLREAIELKV